jgi:hypothetical protein
MTRVTITGVGKVRNSFGFISPAGLMIRLGQKRILFTLKSESKAKSLTLTLIFTSHAPAHRPFIDFTVSHVTSSHSFFGHLSAQASRSPDYAILDIVM